MTLESLCVLKTLVQAELLAPHMKNAPGDDNWLRKVRRAEQELTTLLDTRPNLVEGLKWVEFEPQVCCGLCDGPFPCGEHGHSYPYGQAPYVAQP